MLPIEVLPPETVIERLTGDGKKEDLIAPLWTADKLRVLGGIDQTLDHWEPGRAAILPAAKTASAIF